MRDPMPLRSVRISDRTWQDAQAKAESEDRTVSDVIREALETYITS